MPEGPSLVILRERAASLAGLKVLEASGNTKVDLSRLPGSKLIALRTWGKHFLMDFGDFAVRIHMLMFGSYCIDERKDHKSPRLSLRFSKGRELNFYSCSVKFIDEPLDAVYDWSADVMSDAWDPNAARRKLKAMPAAICADALLDQDVFAGVGNIIKNEVLHRIRVHPATRIGDLPPRKLGELIHEARDYAFDFHRWKLENTLRAHWQVHAKTTCPRDGTPLSLERHLGQKQRRAFWCGTCQVRYGGDAAADVSPVPRKPLAKAAGSATKKSASRNAVEDSATIAKKGSGNARSASRSVAKKRPGRTTATSHVVARKAPRRTGAT